MTDYSELIEELREQARLEDEYPEDAIIKRRAADALEAQGKRIAALRAAMEPVSLWSFEAQDGSPPPMGGAIKQLHDDIMRIRAALKGER
jgi:hypothetical protein